MHSIMQRTTAFVFIVSCWATTHAAPLTAGSQTGFSASLLYIYATDPIYWPDLTGKLLRENDTLLILPDVVYKVWCEVLPEGRPKIFSNSAGVIAHQPTPWKTIAHVELQRTLFNTLNGPDTGLAPAKLWCNYTNGTSTLRTEVFLKPFAISNTTCNYSTLNGLVAEGSPVNFTCTSWSSYPSPEHSCDIVRDDGAAKLQAQVASVDKSTDGRVVSTFSMLASRANRGASVECGASQEVAYDGSGRSFKESYAQKVLPLGRSNFAFVSESTKQCEMILTGDYGVTVRCQSIGGLPDTEHSCRIFSRTGESEALSLMAKIQEATYLTEAAFNNSWAYQGATVTCVLSQQAYFSRNFSFRIPGFRQSAKSCQFSELGEDLRAECVSGIGLPASEHSCAVVDRLDHSSSPLAPNETIIQNKTQSSNYLVPQSTLYRSSQIVCTIKQSEFPPGVYVHRVPRIIESRKSCRFVESSWEVRAVCEFSSGYPVTHSVCQLLVSNSTVSLNLKLDEERADPAAHSVSHSYTVKLPGPNASHSGGSVTCRVFQAGLFSRTFAHRIPEQRRATRPRQPPLAERRAEAGPTAASGHAATEEPEMRLSSHTIVTLALALLAAVLLIVLMSLPIHALRSCLRRSRKEAPEAPAPPPGASASAAAAPAVRRVQPAATAARRSQVRSFALHGILSDVCNNRGYRCNRQEGVLQDIDQYSMFEFGYRPDPGNKRKSVLADALLRCQMEQLSGRREHRFSM